MKRIASIQDISCLGRCSLTVALPVISAMGVECAIVPTAVLSAHTAFPGFVSRDLSDQLPAIADHWRSQQVHFDALYTEYGGSVQFLMVNMTDGNYDTIESVKDFVSGEGYGFPVYYDTEMSAAAAYAVQSIPRTLFIRADGSLAAEQIGMMEEDTLREKIENLIC